VNGLGSAVGILASAVRVRLTRFVTGVAWRMPVLLAVIVTGCLAAYPRLGLSPRQWEDHAVAAGLRLPAEALSGLWRGLLALLYAVLSPSTVETVLWTVGCLSGGALVLLAYGIFSDLLPGKVRARLRAVPEGLFWERCLLATGALAFVSSPAVWTCCRAPGPSLGQLLTTVGAVRLALVCLRGRHYYLLPVVALALGLLIGDGFFALVPFLLLLGYLQARAVGRIGQVSNVLSNPIVLRVVTVRMMFAFVGAALAAWTADYLLYRLFGGLKLSETLSGDVLRALVGESLTAMRSTSTVIGWCFALLTSVMPFVVLRLAVPRVFPEEGPPSRIFLGAAGVCAAVAVTQTVGFRSLNADSWAMLLAMRGEFAGSLLALTRGLVFVWATALLLGSLPTEPELRLRRFGWIFAGLVWVLALAGSLPTRVQPQVLRMQAVIDAFCREVARSCAADVRLVTDGAVDVGIELAAFREGRRLTAISLVSGDAPRDVALRQRGIDDREDLKALASGGPDALRMWIEVRTNRLAGVAALAGFDRRYDYPSSVRPRLSGLVAHFGGEAGAEERRGRAEARTLGARILAICARGDSTSGDPVVRSVFRFVQWRVGEMCRIRSRLAATAADAVEIAADNRLAEDLEKTNPLLGSIRLRHGWLAEHHGAVILPHEGVLIGIKKSDFRMASHYAEEVLKSDPDDPEANFATGMFHYFNRQFARAVPYLKRVLVKRGEDPAVLNNLALAHLRLGRAEEAIAYAERARRAAPDDATLRTSADRIRRKALELTRKGRP